MDPPACSIVGGILYDLCSKWCGLHSGNWNLLASDSISLRHRIWVFNSASLRIWIGRILNLEYPRFPPDDSELHLFVGLRFSNCAPMYFSAPLSATSLDWFWIQSSAPLRLVDPPKMVSFVRIGVDWFRDLSRKSSPTFWCSDSSQPYLIYPAHVLLTSEPSSWSVFLSILVTCTWTLRLFPSSNHTFKASASIVSNQ